GAVVLYLLLLAFPFQVFVCFFFTDSETPEIYTLSLHDALPISARLCGIIPDPVGKSVDICGRTKFAQADQDVALSTGKGAPRRRSEEHTSELQSRENLVCRLLLEKKKELNATNNDRVTGLVNST